jgi:4-amino-4-deoxy-L-arabinose transferase-like glycosyltransferase
MGAAAILRFWRLGSLGWQYDEITYHLVATNVMHGSLTEKVTYGSRWQPFLYQPPWYPYLLAGWFRLTAATIFNARVLGVMFSLCSLVLAWVLIRVQAGAKAALFATVPLAFDGWLLYVDRVSYIENLVLAVTLAAWVAYQHALRHPSWQWFTAAGLAFGAAACLKYTGVYVILAAALAWLIVRRDHKGHLVMLGTALGLLALDQATLFAWWGRYYEQETLLQVRRVLGIQSSGGTLTSSHAFVHLLAAQYRIFLLSFLVGAAGFALMIQYLWRCYRARHWAPVQPQVILFSWSLAGVLTFGLSNLRFPQYFALVLVPLYLLFWTEAWQRFRAIPRLTLLAMAVAAGMVSLWLGVQGQASNPMRQVQHYAVSHIPAHAVVIADEQAGDVLSQPYCREQQANPCVRRARYVITWHTYLQSTWRLGNPAFQQLMRTAVPLARFPGFSGTATVWRLGPPEKPARPPLAHPVLGVDLYAASHYPFDMVTQNGARNLAYIRRHLHAQSVGIVWNLYSPGRRSNSVTRSGSLSLSAGEVAALTRQAQALGMSVEYRPLIRVGPAANWEGHITPASAQAWFRSLYRAELPYLRVAQRLHAGTFVVGTELKGLYGSPEWRGFLARVHHVYHGTVSYSSWQDQYYAQPGLLPPTFVTGVDPYPIVHAGPTATVSQLVAAWDTYFSTVPASVRERTIMQEVGIAARANAYPHPSKWGKPGPYNRQVQVRWFTAACKVAAKYHMRGIYFYEVNLLDDPANPLPFPAFFEGNRAASAAIRGCRKIFAS